MKNKDLASIVERVQQNKKKHFEHLYAVTWETVYFLSYKMMGNEKDAEDVSQEIFIRIYNSIDQLKVPEAFNQWMNRMVMNACTRALEKRPNPLIHVDNEPYGDLALGMEELDKEFLPLEFIDSKETRTMVGQTIQELPEKQKQAVLLHYYEELTIPEIAQILECSSGVVNNRLYFAKKSMEMKLQAFQKEHNVKLYSITGAPTFITLLKQYAEDVCTESVKVDVWQRIGSGLNFGVLALSFQWIKKKISRNNSSKSSVGISVSGISTVLTKAMAVLAVVSVVVTSSVLGSELLNNLDGTNGNSFNQGTQKNGKQEGDKSNRNSGTSDTNGNNRSEKEGDSSDSTVSEETNFTQGKSSAINGGNQDNSTGEIVKGSPIASVSTLNSQIELPAGSVVTNNEGDRLYLSQFGSLDAESNIITQGSVTRVPSGQVAYISVDEAGNKILPENSYITLPTGEINCYPGKIQIHGTYNTVKKLPVVVDVKEGDMTIIAQGNQLILSVNGTEKVVPKDIIIDVINTGTEERTVVVDGCSVTFGVLEAELKTINQGNAVFTTKNEIVENTYTTGKTLVYKTNGVKGQVATEASDYMAQEYSGQNLTNKGSALSGIPEKGPNYIKFIVIGTINILSLGYLILLGVKKRRERQRMKINKTVKKVCALGLTLLLIGGMTVPSAFAQIDENTLDLTTQTENISTEGTDQIVPETPEVVPPTGDTEITPEPDGIQAVAPTSDTTEVTGVAELVADETTLEAAFPDPAFREYVAVKLLSRSTYVDATNKGDTLTGSNITIIQTKTIFSPTGLGIISLEGIEHFAALTTLNCYNNNLSSLDVSNLTSLTTLNCYTNKITELDVSNLTSLTTLNCSGNQLSSLNVSNLISLITLNCSDNQLSSLDVSTLISLTTLNCYINKITELDVSNLINLATLTCAKNQISELNLSNLVNLNSLVCYENCIETLDVSNLEKISILRCYDNKIEILELENLNFLTTLDCKNNQLKQLNLSGSNNIATLNCYNNQLSSLDVSNLTSLTTLNCYINKITELDVSALASLTALNCSSNQLSSLNVSTLTNLTTLNCSINKITELDVSNLNSLTTLLCHRNQLSALDVSNLTALTQLICYLNKISILDVSKMDNLKDLQIFMNPIDSIEISEVAKSQITNLQYRGTNIKSLDLAGFISLNNLSVTKATNADLSAIKMLYISGTRSWENPYLVRLAADQGGFSWDSNTGYYVIKPNMNGSYGFNIPTSEKSEEYIYINGVVGLPEGGLVDEEGNLVIGATLDSVNLDGSITIPAGASIATPEGTFTFDGPASLKDGKISTESPFSFGKNTFTVDSETGVATPVVGGIVTKIEPGNGVSTISTNGSEMAIPAGSAVTDNGGDKTFLTESGKIDSEGKVISETESITVPASKVGDIKEEDGKIYFPADSTITDKEGNKTVYPGLILYDTGDNTVKLLPYELDLAGGNITITENPEGKLVIIQDGVETILSGDTVLAVKNTGNTDNKITVDGTGSVDGIDVKFGNVDGDLEALNGSNVTVNGNVKGDITIDDTSTVTVTGTVEGKIINKGGIFNITGDVTGDVTTTEGGQTKVDGSVTVNVTTDGAGSKTEVTGNVDGKVTDTNGGKTTVDGDSHYALNTDKAYDLLGKINGLDLSKYTDDSVKALNNALAAVMAIIEPTAPEGPQAFAILPDPSQASLDDAVAMLQVAYDGLVLKSQIADPIDPNQKESNTNGTTTTQNQGGTSAKTGDDTNARVYVGLFLMGIGLLAGIVAIQRRRKTS